jgi:hypothetical protein
MLNRLGAELHNDADGTPRSVSMPAIRLPPLDTKAIEAEAKEAAAKVRVIRAGRDAWATIGRAQSFDAWKAIGAALSIGKAHALKVTGANAAWGRNYSREFNLWIRQHGFAGMQKSVRSVAIELAENIDAIEQWRSTLPEKQRRRLVHPLSNVRRWKASTAHGNGRCPQDLKRDAKAAWGRFRSCLEALPAGEAQPLWRLIAAEATTRVS